ncbi:MAG TPA: metal ABC transporter permease [Actinomycetota bacterium]|nr:metal ABC transporter permease [Actinomycetota bacterium]
MIAFALPWPFDRTYMQLALAAGLVVGAAAPLIGAFLVQKRMSLLGDGIGHIAFAGVAGGLLLGVWPVWTALVVSVASALVIERLRARGTSGDLALALFFYGGIAAGVVITGLAGSLNANLFAYLFGSILTVGRADVVVVVVLGVVIVATMAVTRRALFAVVVDEEWARVAGLPVDLLNGILAALTAVTIVAAIRVVGVLLIAAMIVLPVACARLVARSFRRQLTWSMVIGMGAALVGLIAARAWALAPGGSIVLTAVLTYAVLAIATVRRRRSQRFSIRMVQ